RVSPTRRVRISIPFSLKRIQFSKQSAKIKGGHVPQDMEPQAFHQLLTSNDKLKVPEAAFQTTEGWSLPPNQYYSAVPAGASSSKAVCKARTANSRYFSSMTTETLISEVEIIWILIFSLASASNMRLATPACERMPTPTIDTLAISTSPTTS